MSQDKGQLNNYSLTHLRAKYNVLKKDDLYFFNQVTRWYSEKYHTPLHLVRENKEVLWSDVLEEYYDFHASQQSYNELYNEIYEELFPDEVEEKDTELMRRLELMQNQQLTKKTPPNNKQKQKSQSLPYGDLDNKSTLETQEDVNVVFDDSPPEDL